MFCHSLKKYHDGYGLLYFVVPSSIILYFPAELIYCFGKTYHSKNILFQDTNILCYFIISRFIFRGGGILQGYCCLGRLALRARLIFKKCSLYYPLISHNSIHLFPMINIIFCNLLP